MSDSGRSRVYNAEFQLRDIFSNGSLSRVVKFKGMTLTLPDERKFGALETVQSYADAVIEMVRDTYPAKRVPVIEGRKSLRHRAYWDWEKIVLPQREVGAWAWRETVVLHEIAHHLTPGAGHNGEFCGAFVYLLTEIIGPEAGWLMGVLLNENGIEYKAKEIAYA